MALKWVIFDLDDTLFDFDAAETFALDSLLHAVNHKPEKDILPLYQDINTELWAAFERGGLDAQQVKVGRFERLFAELGIKADASYWADHYLDFLAKGSNLLPGARQCLIDLNPYVQMGVITNGLTRVQQPRLQQSGLEEAFEFVVISEQAGVVKPQAEIFDIAHAHTGHCEKQEILMVGDRLETDILGANNFGIQSCWFNLRHKVNSTEIQPDFEIQQLAELVDLVRHQNS